MIWPIWVKIRRKRSILWSKGAPISALCLWMFPPDQIPANTTPWTALIHNSQLPDTPLIEGSKHKKTFSAPFKVPTKNNSYPWNKNNSNLFESGMLKKKIPLQTSSATLSLIIKVIINQKVLLNPAIRLNINLTHLENIYLSPVSNTTNSKSIISIPTSFNNPIKSDYA